MEKNIRESLLLEFYGELLTKKQREVMQLYVDCDISLSEIASNLGSTRQAVYDTVKISLASLEEFEKKLKKVRNYSLIMDSLDLTEKLDKNNEAVKEIKSNLEKMLKN